jgi:hypothetical protein
VGAAGCLHDSRYSPAGYLAVAFGGIALAGLALWFTGTNMADTNSAAELAQRVDSVGRSMVGAGVLIGAMVVFGSSPGLSPAISEATRR